MRIKLEHFPKEQLIVFLHNEELENERLREKLFLLTGCREFGNMDGMDGTCVYCNEKDKNLADRCFLFTNAFSCWYKRHPFKNADVNEAENNNGDLSF